MKTLQQKPFTDNSPRAKASREVMWDFLMQFGQKADPEQLKSYVKQLIAATTQKDAGQRSKRGHVDWNELDMIIWGIVIEATALVLSGEMDRLKGDNGET